MLQSSEPGTEAVPAHVIKGSIGHAPSALAPDLGNLGRSVSAVPLGAQRPALAEVVRAARASSDRSACDEASRVAHAAHARLPLHAPARAVAVP
jgi:hypothetical protein